MGWLTSRWKTEEQRTTEQKAIDTESLNRVTKHIREWNEAVETERRVVRIRLQCYFCSHVFAREYGKSSNLTNPDDHVFREGWKFARFWYDIQGYTWDLSWWNVKCPNCDSCCHEVGREPILAEGSDE